MKQFLTLMFGLFVSCAGIATVDAQPSATKLAGFKNVFLSDWKDMENKLVTLAEAIPAEKYSWRPAQGVRSVSEVFMHVAGANYFMTGPVGVKPPAGFGFNSEKTVTEKGKVIQALRASFVEVPGCDESLGIRSEQDGHGGRPADNL